MFKLNIQNEDRKRNKRTGPVFWDRENIYKKIKEKQLDIYIVGKDQVRKLTLELIRWE